MKYSLVLQLVGLLKLLLNLFCAVNIQERELCLDDFITYTSYTGQCSDIYKLICYNLYMMLNTTKLFSLIPVWMTLTFTQDLRGMGKL